MNKDFKNITLEDLAKQGIVTNDLVEFTLFADAEYDEGKMLEPFGKAQGYNPPKVINFDKEGVKTAGYIRIPEHNTKTDQKNYVFLVGVTRPPTPYSKMNYMFSWYVQFEAVKSFRKL